MQVIKDIKKLLRYNPDDGQFYRTTDRGPHKAGSLAGSKSQDGYVRIQVCGRQYLGHRLAWLVVYEEEPNSQIDHINGIRDDNRIENLRLASCAQNNQNKAVSKKNKSGVSGVWRYGNRNAWRVGIKVNKKLLHIGVYENFEEAVAARNDAVKKYHPFFARP